MSSLAKEMINKKCHMILLLIGLLMLVTLVGCQGGRKPRVSNIPDGWRPGEEVPYPYISNGGRWGLIQYEDRVDGDYVQIFYGDVPPELKGNERDEDALRSRAIHESAGFDSTESGTMTIGEWLVGYARAYNAELGVYDMEMIFVSKSTCVDIYARFGATSEDERQVMSIIESIDF